MTARARIRRGRSLRKVVRLVVTRTLGLAWIGPLAQSMGSKPALAPKVLIAQRSTLRAQENHKPARLNASPMNTLALIGGNATRRVINIAPAR